MRNFAAGLSLIALAAASSGGCDAVMGIRSVESPTYICHIDGPKTVIAGQPVNLEVWAFAGSDGTYHLKSVTADVIQASKTVAISAITENRVDRNAGGLAVILGCKPEMVSFIPTATGVYRVEATAFGQFSYGPASGGRQRPNTPTATLDIEVVVPQ
jgi:hypothetical protein